MSRPAVAISQATVLLTGASGGLGDALAQAFDERGAKLVITGRRVDVLDRLAAGLSQARVCPCDMADRHELGRFLGQLDDIGIDILVANAALPAAGPLHDFTIEEMDRALDVNLRAPMVLAKHLAPRMEQRGRGHLVFVASMGAKLPASRLAIYAATKYGLRGFAASLRQELSGGGVGVSTIFPGPVEGVGMWAEAQAVGRAATVSAGAVAAAAVRAIEWNKAEIDVAPWSLRLGAAFAHAFPGSYARAALRSGADEQTAAMAAGLRHKR